MPTRLHALLLITVALLAGFLSEPAAADEVVLIPLIYFDPVQGRNGAQWQTDFTMENYGDVDWQSDYFPGGCWTDFVWVPAHSTVKNPFCIGPDEAALLDVRDDQRLRFELRVRDSAAPSVNYGAEIPVVRTSEAIRGPSGILDVSSSLTYRRTIRIYSLSRTESFRFTLKIRRLRSTDVEFEYSAELPPPSHLSRASLVRLSDGAELPDLEALGDLKFEIVPANDDVPYWWFLSLASNTSNELTVVSPQ